MINTLKHKMKEQGLNALIVSDPRSIYYFSGATIDPGERMYMLILTEKTDYFVAAEMFQSEAEEANAALEKRFFKDTEDYLSIPAAIIADNGGSSSKIGIDKNLVAKFLLPMMNDLPNASFVDGSRIIDEIRMVKTKEQQAKIRESAHLCDKIIGEFIKYLDTEEALGITEKDGFNKVLEIAENLGVEGLSFPPIVCFGEGSAEPHHESSKDVVLKPGVPVLMDIGFVKHGYCSDMTRTLFRTKEGMTLEGSDEFKKIYNIVKNANLAGIAKVKPGVPLAEIDAAARDYIKEAGYGEFFVHRLGHGIGIECHEYPDVSSASEAVCEVGMTFSIEPGIYHKESGIGVRVEDIVLVTEDGCEVLNQYSK